MKVSARIDIAAPTEAVWRAITDIENSTAMISGILDIEVLEQPEEGIVGLRWKETRRMFGKEASEIMWITEAVDNAYYHTRAESHGSVYTTELKLDSGSAGDCTTLTMTFSGEAQTPGVKIAAFCMGFFVRPSMKKTLQQDLADIKRFVETSR